MQKIDVFCHILPERYLRERNARASFGGSQYGRYYQANPALTDLDLRFRVMDRHPDVAQLLTIAGPNVESVTEPHDSVELSRIANDELAEFVAEYPDRFVGAAACLPMNDVDAALREAERLRDKAMTIELEEAIPEQEMVAVRLKHRKLVTEDGILSRQGGAGSGNAT